MLLLFKGGLMNNQLTKEQQELVEKNHNLIYGFANKNKLNIEEYYGILANTLDFVLLCLLYYLTI